MFLPVSCESLKNLLQTFIYTQNYESNFNRFVSVYQYLIEILISPIIPEVKKLFILFFEFLNILLFCEVPVKVYCHFLPIGFVFHSLKFKES